MEDRLALSEASRAGALCPSDKKSVLATLDEVYKKFGKEFNAKLVREFFRYFPESEYKKDMVRSSENLICAMRGFDDISNDVFSVSQGYCATLENIIKVISEKPKDPECEYQWAYVLTIDAAKSFLLKIGP